MILLRLQLLMGRMSQLVQNGIGIAIGIGIEKQIH